jgi:hypothetical protein
MLDSWDVPGLPIDPRRSARTDAHPYGAPYAPLGARLAFPSHDGVELPEIVRKAQEDIRCRAALARLGYSKVKAEYAWHKRHGKETFLSLEHQFLWPTTDFIRVWLKAERRRILARLRWPFLGAMLATVLAGVLSAWILNLLQW